MMPKSQSQKHHMIQQQIPVLDTDLQTGVHRHIHNSQKVGTNSHFGGLTDIANATYTTTAVKCKDTVLIKIKISHWKTNIT